MSQKQSYVVQTRGTRLRYAFTMFCALFSTLVCGVGYMVSERLRPRSGMFRRWGSRWGRWLFGPAGLRVDATLDEDVGSLTPCVFVSNHQNALDIPALLMALPVEFGFVAKASLSKVPVLGHAIAASPSVFVERRDPRLSHASMQTAAKTIREGSSVLVFPEGERSYSTDVKAFKRSAFTLAAEAGVPVVPVTIHNAHELFDERHRVCRSGTVRISVGDSFRIAGTERSDVNEAAARAREIIVGRLGGHHPAAGSQVGAYREGSAMESTAASTAGATAGATTGPSTDPAIDPATDPAADPATGPATGLGTDLTIETTTGPTTVPSGRPTES